MKLLIVSTSTVYGKPYLSYLEEECKDFFPAAGNILFIPYARPGGISHDGYTAKAKEVLERWGFSVKGAHELLLLKRAANGPMVSSLAGETPSVLPMTFAKVATLKP